MRILLDESVPGRLGKLLSGHSANMATLPVAILVVLARSNRMEDLARAVPTILQALDEIPPRTLRKVAA